MKTCQWLRILFLSIMLCSSYSLQASAEWSINIDMTVVKPQCMINNNKEILIDFQRVFVDKIDGQEYKKTPIQLTITCSNVTSADLRVQIIGKKTNFAINDNLLGTDNPDLGIKILADNERLPVNTWLSFSWPQRVPALAAVLVKRDKAILYDGKFTAGAVMSLDYN